MRTRALEPRRPRAALTPPSRAAAAAGQRRRHTRHERGGRRRRWSGPQLGPIGGQVGGRRPSGGCRQSRVRHTVREGGRAREGRCRADRLLGPRPRWRKQPGRGRRLLGRRLELARGADLLVALARALVEMIRWAASCCGAGGGDGDLGGGGGRLRRAAALPALASAGAHHAGNGSRRGRDGSKARGGLPEVRTRAHAHACAGSSTRARVCVCVHCSWHLCDGKCADSKTLSAGVLLPRRGRFLLLAAWVCPGARGSVRAKTPAHHTPHRVLRRCACRGARDS